MVTGAVDDGAVDDDVPSVEGGTVEGGTVDEGAAVVVDDGTVTTTGAPETILDTPTSAADTPPGAPFPITRLEQYHTPSTRSQSILGSEQLPAYEALASDKDTPETAHSSGNSPADATVIPNRTAITAPANAAGNNRPNLNALSTFSSEEAHPPVARPLTSRPIRACDSCFTYPYMSAQPQARR